MLTTLPNLLTLSRIVAIPLVVITFYLPSPYGPWIGCGLFALAGFTDWLDGRLARLWQQQSELGRFLDPIADKLLVAAVLFMLAALQLREDPPPGKLVLAILFVLPALVILSREILVSGLREHLAGLRVSVPVSRLAKWKTGLQMGAIGVLLVGDAGPSWLPVTVIGELMLWAAAVLTMVTGYDYLRAGLTHINGEPSPVQAKPSSVA
ncbi:MAG TPA: CDP-diacylglycerol--glycerol-3-phosphate 3-phosphatidyltransferase [Stellaceae bacterium]|jgi:cardiolipin synthase|nr:CDP-diacylglycerol--glycerol-3-phosphate 3-phosphatidyltransferase [Stellaceae bacterium]